jgi:hypothetical protein
MIFAAIIVRVHHTLERLGTECSMEELMTLCPELMWSHVFLAIDYLSRSWQIHVTLDGDGMYRMRTLHATTVTASSAALVAV